MNVYGQTKRDGEKALQAYCPNHLIFRTSWVYAGKGNNFAKTMLRLAKERKELSVINDQVGAPTGAELLADCTAHAIRVAMVKPEVAGLYHLVASDTTTGMTMQHWYLMKPERQASNWRLKSSTLCRQALTRHLLVGRRIRG